MAISLLEEDTLRKLFKAQATGTFFEALPMRYYGGTALAYACSLQLREAVVALLATGYVDLNDRADGCHLTGFLPIHAVIANSANYSACDMYDFVTGDLKPEWRADSRQLTKVGVLDLRDGILDTAALSPLQLAAQLGDHATVRHVLRKQCEIEWIWGPVTSFLLNLDGIDSSGQGGGDIMELIVRNKAGRKTTEMLLSSFMNGFIWALYERKWKLYGRKLHWTIVSLDATLIVANGVYSFLLKSSPESQAYLRPILFLIVGLMSVLALRECFVTFLHIQNERASGDAQQTGLAYYWLRAKTFIMQHGVHLQLTACSLTAAALLISYTLPSPESWTVTTGWYDSNQTVTVSYAQLQAAGRSLRGGGGPASAADIALYNAWQLTNEGAWALLWLVQGLSLLFLTMHLATVFFQPFLKTNILFLTIWEMIRNDIAVFMAVFFWLFIAFYLCLFVVYPRSGDMALPQVKSFNSLMSVLGLLDLSLLGERIEFNPLLQSAEHLSHAQFITLWVWLMLYYVWLGFSMILMINLLIAMLTNTYEMVRAESDLRARLSFATGIMKLELIADALGMRTHVGQTHKDYFVYQVGDDKGGPEACG